MCPKSIPQEPISTLVLVNIFINIDPGLFYIFTNKLNQDDMILGGKHSEGELKIHYLVKINMIKSAAFL